MASCVDVPTLTTTQVSTSQSLVTTTTESISTAPGSVSTVVVSTCAQVGTASSCIPTVSTSFITVPGGATTIIVPTTLTVNVPVTVLTTLFGSSCSSSSISSSSTPSIPTPTPTPTPTSSTYTFSDSLTSISTDTSSSTATLTIVTTPSPTVITTNSLVTSDGSIFLSSFTTTSTQSPVTTVMAQSTNSPSSRNIAVGPVVGGIVGGLAVLLLLGLLTWRLVKRQSKFDRFFNRDDDYLRGPHHGGPLIEKPTYQYGMVGQPTSNPVSLDPQHLDPAVQNAFGNSSGTGQAQGPLQQSTAGQAVIGNDGGLGQASGPLVNGGGLGQASGPPGTGGGLGQQTVAGASHGVIGNMPPIAHTGDPSLIPLITGKGTAAGASGLLTAATSSRPSSSRPSTGSSSQALGPLVTPANTQGGYPPALQSRNTSQVYGQAHSGPSKSLNNNGTTKLSISSLASTSSAYSSASWNGNSSTNHTITGDNSGSVPPILPSMEASSHQQQYQQHHRRTSFVGVASRQVTNNADYEYNPYAEVGSSSMGGVSSSQEAPFYDEQGRPLDIPPEKVPLVHLDGALYQESPRDDPSPAYAE